MRFGPHSEPIVFEDGPLTIGSPTPDLSGRIPAVPKAAWSFDERRVVEFTYSVDARDAVARFPGRYCWWDSAEPWPDAAACTADDLLRFAYGVIGVPLGAFRDTVDEAELRKAVGKYIKKNGA